jgi:hypothetical protein
MKLAATASAALLAVPLAAMTADSVNMAPGRWIETTTTTAVTLGGRAAAGARLNQPASRMVCLTPEEAAEPALYFQSKAPSGACAAPTGTVAGGRIKLASTCEDANTPRMMIEVSGTYARDSYSAAIRAQSLVRGQPAVIDMTLTGRFDGACRGDEEPNPAK